jgi:hypothetical protein
MQTLINEIRHQKALEIAPIYERLDTTSLNTLTDVQLAEAIGDADKVAQAYVLSAKAHHFGNFGKKAAGFHHAAGEAHHDLSLKHSESAKRLKKGTPARDHHEMQSSHHYQMGQHHYDQASRARSDYAGSHPSNGW